MVNVATCSYSEYKPEMGAAVRISLGSPRWWKTPPPASIWSLTPRREYLHSGRDVYLPRYFAQLDYYGVDMIRQEFERVAKETGQDTIVLLCFEKLDKKGAGPDHWCHRREFAQWWMEQTGEILPELGGLPPAAGDTPPEPEVPLEEPLF